ncbi:fumarylacetoacetate hydrolase family protein [Vibrio mexicanus]|uniref:fumarylacetoacetate hydrolase family protein n=1 Tax=Vibrio mexicanus TaxID=1004326 RepID=UPI000ADA457C|nr:fumarylacetoacetate hydrolase family protein [Vibrio mexicanus]
MKVSRKAIISTLLFSILPLTNAKAAKIAPIEQAITLAQVNSESGQKHTYLVLNHRSDKVGAVNLSEHYNYYPDDALSFLNQFDYNQLQEISDALKVQNLNINELLPAGGERTQHVAAGANYVEHSEEADIHEVFLFPKFATPTPTQSQIRYSSEVLLDYEVELCMRWVEGLKADPSGYVGLFVCGDFTDRAELLRKIDVDNVTSGHGFSDAKSGATRFPTGPYIVVPKDWSSFVDQIDLETVVNGITRQAALASEMIVMPDELMERILYQGGCQSGSTKIKPYHYSMPTLNRKA